MKTYEPFAVDLAAGERARMTPEQRANRMWEIAELGRLSPRDSIRAMDAALFLVRLYRRRVTPAVAITAVRTMFGDAVTTHALAAILAAMVAARENAP